MGVCSYMETFNFFFGISLGELVLRHSDNLSRTLQSPRLSAAEAQKVVKMTVKTWKAYVRRTNLICFGQKLSKKVLTSEFKTRSFLEEERPLDDMKLVNLKVILLEM